MGKAKLVLMTALATMAFAASAFAAPPSGYDAHVNVAKVTPLEAKTDGYCHEYIFDGVMNTESEVPLAVPNQPVRVTPLEAKTDGYCHEYIFEGVMNTESEVPLAVPNA